jgi:hypothetical protein
MSMTVNGPVRGIGLTSRPDGRDERSAVRRRGERILTESQIEAVRRAMRVFVEDDLARGVLASSLQPCDACQSSRPAVGFIHYGGYHVCNQCATAYELALMSGAVFAIDQFIRTHPPHAA